MELVRSSRTKSIRVVLQSIAVLLAVGACSEQGHQNLEADAAVAERLEKLRETWGAEEDAGGEPIVLVTAPTFVGQMEPGSCVLRFHTWHEDGTVRRMRDDCRVEYQGSAVTVVCDTVVLRGSLSGGSVELRGTEYGGSFLMTGYALSPRRVVGVSQDLSDKNPLGSVTKSHWEIVVESTE